MHHPTVRIAHTTAFVTPVVDHWMERNGSTYRSIDPATHRTMSERFYHGGISAVKNNLIAHTTAFVTPVVDHWLEREIAQWVHPTKDRSDDPSHHERTLLPRSYISLPGVIKADVCSPGREIERVTHPLVLIGK